MRYPNKATRSHGSRPRRKPCLTISSGSKRQRNASRSMCEVEHRGRSRVRDRIEFENAVFDVAQHTWAYGRDALTRTTQICYVCHRVGVGFPEGPPLLLFYANFETHTTFTVSPTEPDIHFYHFTCTFKICFPTLHPYTGAGTAFTEEPQSAPRHSAGGCDMSGERPCGYATMTRRRTSGCCMWPPSCSRLRSRLSGSRPSGTLLCRTALSGRSRRRGE